MKRILIFLLIVSAANLRLAASDSDKEIQNFTTKLENKVYFGIQTNVAYFFLPGNIVQLEYEDSNKIKGTYSINLLSSSKDFFQGSISMTLKSKKDSLQILDFFTSKQGKEIRINIDQLIEINDKILEKLRDGRLTIEDVMVGKK